MLGECLRVIWNQLRRLLGHVHRPRLTQSREYVTYVRNLLV
jgi:hypothetical protein